MIKKEHPRHCQQRIPEHLPSPPRRRIKTFPCDFRKNVPEQIPDTRSECIRYQIIHIRRPEIKNLAQFYQQGEHSSCGYSSPQCPAVLKDYRCQKALGLKHLNI